MRDNTYCSVVRTVFVRCFAAVLCTIRNVLGLIIGHMVAYEQQEHLAWEQQAVISSRHGQHSAANSTARCGHP